MARIPVASWAWRRVATAMLLAPPGLSIAMMRLRSVAMTWARCGADLTGALAVDDVADEVQGFDAPAIARSRSIRHDK